MNYVRNTWYVAGWSQDFEPNKPASITILGEPVVIWRNSDNALTATIKPGSRGARDQSRVSPRWPLGV